MGDEMWEMSIMFKVKSDTDFNKLEKEFEKLKEEFKIKLDALEGVRYVI